MAVHDLSRASRAAVRYQLARLKEDVQTKKIAPPDTPTPDTRLSETNPASSALRSIRIALGALDELIELSGDWARYFDFLDRHKSTLLTKEVERVLLLAADVDPGWPLHEGHLFILRHSYTSSIADSVTLISSPENLNDYCLALLDNESFFDLHLAGAAWVMRFKNSHLGYFYAALGAELDGRSNLAVGLMTEAGSACPKNRTGILLTQIREIGARFDVRPGNVEALLDSFGHGMTRTDDAESHRMRGRELASSGRWADALISYEKAIERMPGQSDLHHSRGMMLGCLGRWEESVEAYDAALQIEPEMATLGNRGESLIMLGRLDEAETSLRMALDAPGVTYFEATVLLALLVAAKDPAEMKALCKTALQGQMNGISPFRCAELSAIALTLLDDLDRAETVMREGAKSHVVLDIFEEPLYTLLAKRNKAGADRLTSIWAEITSGTAR